MAPVEKTATNLCVFVLPAPKCDDRLEDGKLLKLHTRGWLRYLPKYTEICWWERRFIYEGKELQFFSSSPAHQPTTIVPNFSQPTNSTNASSSQQPCFPLKVNESKQTAKSSGAMSTTTSTSRWTITRHTYTVSKGTLEIASDRRSQ